MRWQQLFADLAAQFDQAEAAAGRPETAARVRAEFGAVRLADRLGGSVGSTILLRCRGTGVMRGVLTDVGADWLLLDDGRGGDLLVATAAVATASGLSRLTAPAPEPGAVRSRLDLRWAVRGLARDRTPVRIALVDGTELTGTVDRVGADFLELAEHAADEPRRAAVVRDVSAVPLTAVAVVRTAAQRLG